MYLHIQSLSLLLLLLALPLSAFAYEYDPENGEEINYVCAGCHGEFGQGGKEGAYPRVAGQPIAFTALQLYQFRSHKRLNLAMVEYMDERQMPDNDIQDIAHYLTAIKLKTRLPPIDDVEFNAYERLRDATKLMQIPRAEGDTKKGRKIYRKECASCHGKEGWGSHKKGVPMLTGQYTNYLWRQVKKYREKVRIHDEEDPQNELLDDFTDTEIQNIFAYLSIMDD